MVDWTPVEETVKEAERQGKVGVHVMAPDGSTWGHRENEQFKAASTVKIPLMVEIYRKIDREELGLDDVHTLLRSERARGSGVLLHMHSGLQVTIGDLLYLMMSISDNTATNLLIDYAGMDAVNETIRDLGMTGSNLGRPMLGRPAIEGEIENLATPADYTLVVQKILNGQAASKGACDNMVATLEKQQNARRIGRHVPEKEGYRWGTKTGSIEGVTNDVGFVITPAGTMIIAVFCAGLPDQITGEQVIADVTKAAMEATGILG